MSILISSQATATCSPSFPAVNICIWFSGWHLSKLRFDLRLHSSQQASRCFLIISSLPAPWKTLTSIVHPCDPHPGRSNQHIQWTALQNSVTFCSLGRLHNAEQVQVSASLYSYIIYPNSLALKTLSFCISIPRFWPLSTLINILKSSVWFPFEVITLM